MRGNYWSRALKDRIALPNSLFHKDNLSMQTPKKIKINSKD